ncbi:MAG: 5,6-dimethylbenzimidazole synthase [Pseudomonadota bacterium]
MRAFSAEFQSDLMDLMRWRRDVRRFRTDPVAPELVAECLEAVRLAPSVGLSEPWRILAVESDQARAAVLANFEVSNADALAGYRDDKAATYAGLKLAGMREAPVQFAVFCDDETSKGDGLGAGTMPEARRYSVVTAVMNFWLRARALGLGVGWVSIFDTDRLARDLKAEPGWSLVAYLCVGWPEEAHLDPELERAGWETRSDHVAVEVR